MSDSPPAPADRNPTSVKRTKRPRALITLAVLAASAFLWPAILQIEKLPARVESLKVLGPAERGQGGDSQKGRGRTARAGHRAGGLTPPAPNFGALREGLPSVLEAQLPPAATTAAAVLAQQFAQPIDFSQPATPQGGPADPFNLPTPNVVDPIGGTPGPGVAPPVTNPPVTPPPVVNPPVTNPPPVVDPGTPPPVVTPPDGPPPVVSPPPVAPPPVISPNPPGGTFTPPGDPGGGGPGGGGPPTGVPEPAVWLDLVLGAGLAGAALRRARLQPVMALRARSRLSTTT